MPIPFPVNGTNGQTAVAVIQNAPNTGYYGTIGSEESPPFELVEFTDTPTPDNLADYELAAAIANLGYEEMIELKFEGAAHQADSHASSNNEHGMADEAVIQEITRKSPRRDRRILLPGGIPKILHGSRGGSHLKMQDGYQRGHQVFKQIEHCKLRAQDTTSIAEQLADSHFGINEFDIIDDEFPSDDIYDSSDVDNGTPPTDASCVDVNLDDGDDEDPLHNEVGELFEQLCPNPIDIVETVVVGHKCTKPDWTVPVCHEPRDEEILPDPEDPERISQAFMEWHNSMHKQNQPDDEFDTARKKLARLDQHAISSSMATA